MIAEKFSLAGKTALVTGAGQGIGKGIALALAEYSANIIVHYKDDKQQAASVAAEIGQLGVASFILEADLSKDSAAQTMVDFVNEHSIHVDILVLNASVQIPAVWTEVSDQDFEQQVNTNFRSSFQLMQKFGPKMAEKGWGRILTIGSVQQFKPHPAMIIYAATKSAILNLVTNVAMQLADRGVTVNNLAPGVIGTARLDQELPDSEERITKRQETPSGQIGSPEDCAAVAILLCSDAGRFVTGQNINVDGGMSL